MRKKNTKNVVIHLIVAILFTFLMILGYSAFVREISSHAMLHRLGYPLLRLLFFIVTGLLIGHMIEASGWLKILSGLFSPFFRFGNLGPYCSAAFTAAFFSGTTSNAMLRNFYEEGKIGKHQLFLTNLVNHFPAYFLHLPTTIFMVIPLTGKAGALYFICTFLAVTLKTSLCLVYGHLMLHASGPGESDIISASHETNKEKKGSIIQAIHTRLLYRMVNIATFVLPIYTGIFLLSSEGFFKRLETLLAQYVTTTIVPIESLSLVILSFMAEFSSGFASAGALLENGVITVKQAVIALLIGNIVAFPIRALRHQLPNYMGIFSPKLGSQLLIYGQILRVISLALIGAGYYYFT